MQATREIHPEMKMEEILELYPSARRALFTRYHIGGCSSCGFSPQDTIEQVFINHNRPTLTTEAIQFIYESARLDDEMQIEPADLKADLEGPRSFRLVDVREVWEADIAAIPGGELLDQELAYEMLQKWPKETPVVFFCHHGHRSLEAAAYFRGHGLTNVKSLKGGIDRWSAEIDPSISRY
jgi:rhodanese-related sulfurtransferase